ncbi:hypothetical protein [Caulobacter soli]|uniref:hypothetical protein n=1 Tax=Caulobacter soli TaxID=2708539 RepID=UPI0013ED547B|nr:hypothetical protein [Caulobacter soli]
MSEVSDKHQAFEMTPTYGLALAFAVLLEGVTSGDASKNPEALMYGVAAALLGISGVSLLATDLARQASKPIGSGAPGKVDRWSWIILAIASSLAIQVLGLVLGYQVCKRASPGIGGVFVLSIMGALVLFGVLKLILGYSLVVALGIRTFLRWRKIKPPRFLTLYIDALSSSATGPTSSRARSSVPGYRQRGTGFTVGSAARPHCRVAPARYRNRRPSN